MSHSYSLEDEFERERLHFAAQDGNVEEVKRLLTTGYQPNQFDDLGKTPLHYAAEREHLDVLNVLLASGADVNAHDERVIGNTPLGEVAGSCSFEVAKILVDAGADPTIPGWMQLTALHKASERKKPDGQRVRQLLEQAARFYQAGT
jgi:ankyrin repeat protein